MELSKLNQNSLPSNLQSVAARSAGRVAEQQAQQSRAAVAVSANETRVTISPQGQALSAQAATVAGNNPQQVAAPSVVQNPVAAVTTAPPPVNQTSTTTQALLSAADVTQQSSGQSATEQAQADRRSESVTADNRREEARQTSKQPDTAPQAFAFNGVSAYRGIFNS